MVHARRSFSVGIVGDIVVAAESTIVSHVPRIGAPGRERRDSTPVGKVDNAVDIVVVVVVVVNVTIRVDIIRTVSDIEFLDRRS